MKDKIRITIDISKEDHTELLKCAVAQDRSFSWLMRKVISDYVNNKRDEYDRLS